MIYNDEKIKEEALMNIKDITQTSLIKPGDHIVILYEDMKEVSEFLTSYLKASLERNERCIYIVGDDNPEEVLNAINRYDLNGNGELVVINKDEVYSKAGKFSPDKMVRLLQKLTEEAIDDGYLGLAVTGEISWVLDYENGRDLIIEYEWKINEQLFDKFPVTALCRYNINKFSDEMIISIIQLHPYLIWKNKIHENPFFIPAEGFKNNDMAKYQVDVWLENISKFTNDKSHFHKELKKKQDEMNKLHKNMTEGIVKAMIELLTTHDNYTNNHSENVASLAQSFAHYLGLPDEFITKIYYAGLAHDIGKILVDRSILNKKEKLSSDEYKRIRQHPIHGANALFQLKELKDIAKAIKYHHERWDGEGYPEGLKEEEIPLMSRIIALADTYEAMISDRPYRKAFNHEEVIEEIKNCSGSQFDPALVNDFISMILEEKKNSSWFYD
jgi:putative nucleotidyltransferase with HDIG domain